MTFYPSDLFDSVAGHVQQIVLAVLLQQEANKDYIPDPLATDFTRDSIFWQLITNTAESATEFNRWGVLQISVTLPLINDSPLLNKQNLYERVGTINSTNIENLTFPRESVYASVGVTAPDPSNPNSVDGGTYPGTANDTLERRLAWLLSTLMAKYWYVKRWNNWAAMLRIYTTVLDIPVWFYQVPDSNSVPGSFLWGRGGASRRLMQMGELPPVELGFQEAGGYDDALQQLILDADSLDFRFSMDVDGSLQFENFGAGGGGGDIGSAAGEENFYDPSAESATNFQSFLSQPPPPSQNSVSDGAVGNETPENSLKDC